MGHQTMVPIQLEIDAVFVRANVPRLANLHVSSHQNIAATQQGLG
jgi:hypothetical protein